MYCVVFNGPPRSGKDTLAQMLVEHMDSRITAPVKQESLSLPLRHIAYSMVGRTYEDSTYEDFKRELFGEFNFTDGRHLMIDVSESFLKPVYGQSIMANMLITRNSDFDGLLLIRDGGFQIEVNPLLTAYGTRNVYIVRVERDGCDFSNDSREWVNHHDHGCSMTVENNGTLDDLRTEAGRIYGRLVNKMGWKL